MTASDGMRLSCRRLNEAPAAVVWYPAQFSEAATFIRPTSAKASVSRRSFKESAKVRKGSPAFIPAASYGVFGGGE